MERVESSSWKSLYEYTILYKKTLFYDKILLPFPALKNSSFPSYSLVLFKLQVDLNDEYRNHGSFYTVLSVYHISFLCTWSFEQFVPLPWAELVSNELTCHSILSEFWCNCLLMLFFLVATYVLSYLFYRAFIIFKLKSSDHARLLLFHLSGSLSILLKKVMYFMFWELWGNSIIGLVSGSLFSCSRCILHAVWQVHVQVFG